MSLDDFNNEGYKISVDDNHKHFVHCRSGYRSTIASSILFRNGIRNIINIIGSFNAIKESEIPMTGTCPTLAVAQSSL